MALFVLFQNEVKDKKSCPQKTENIKAAQPLVGGGLGGILPANLDYRHPEGDPDLEVGFRPTANPLNQGVGPRRKKILSIYYSKSMLSMIKIKQYPGLWLLPLYTGLFYGFLPIISRIMAPLSRYYEQMPSTPILSALSIISTILGIGLVVATFWVWRCSLVGRNIYLGLLAFIILASLASTVASLPQIGLSLDNLPNAAKSVYQLQVVWGIGHPIILIIACIGYFNRSKVKVIFETTTKILHDSENTNAILKSPIEMKNNWIVLVSLTIVIIYRFICSIPFPPESYLPIFSKSPEYLLSSFFILFLRLDQSLVYFIISPVVGTLFWLVIGITVAYFFQRMIWVFITCLGVDILLMILTYYWVGSLTRTLP